MFEDGSTAACNYYLKIIEPDDALSLKFLASNFHRAPLNVNSYLQAQCRNVKGLDAFFKSRTDLFFVENKKVARHDDELEEARQSTTDFFKEKLKEYSNPVDCMKFKLEHFEEASDAIQSFIARFYPGEEFKNFFKLRPDVFSVNKETVFLINVEAVRYFKLRHKRFAKNGVLHFTKLRGHTGQAPPDVQAYINNNYGVQFFKNFLWENDDAFKVDDNGNVTLIEKE